MGDYCHGNGADHCCYVNGQVCPFLEVNTVPGRRWSCGLLNELGDWDLVHNDLRYVEHVKPVWIEAGVDDCGDFMGSRSEGRYRGDITPQCCYKEGANPPVFEL